MAAFARRLPEGLVDPVAAVMARMVSQVLPARRAMVARHQRRARAEGLSGTELTLAVRRTFESYARYWLESFRLPWMSDEEVEARFSIEGFEHIEDGHRSGSGAILAMAHVGNWDLAGRWLGLRVPLTAVVEELEPPELFEWFVRLRGALGFEVVPLGPRAGQSLLRALRDNRVLALMCDRDIGGGGVEVEFFGETTTLPGGPATLGLRTGAPVLPAAVFEQGGGHYRAVVRPPVPAVRTGRLRADVVAVTQSVAVELEGLIRRAPEQWHLVVPNWPSDRT